MKIIHPQEHDLGQPIDALRSPSIGLRSMQTGKSRQRFWSDLDLYELRAALKKGRPLQEIATDLSRDVDDVEAKIAEIAELN